MIELRTTEGLLNKMQKYKTKHIDHFGNGLKCTQQLAKHMSLTLANQKPISNQEKCIMDRQIRQAFGGLHRSLPVLYFSSGIGTVLGKGQYCQLNYSVLKPDCIDSVTLYQLMCRQQQSIYMTLERVSVTIRILQVLLDIIQILTMNRNRLMKCTRRNATIQ